MGKSQKLHYLRTKDKREVDFLISQDNNPLEMVEVNLSDREISKNLSYFKQRYSHIKAIQIVQNLKQGEYNHERDIHVRNAANYLSELSG
jgi:predicted AAA+ superfamily ATPase